MSEYGLKAMPTSRLYVLNAEAKVEMQERILLENKLEASKLRLELLMLQIIAEENAHGL